MKAHFTKIMAAAASCALMAAVGLTGCAGGSTEAGSASGPAAQEDVIELQIFAANSLEKAMNEVQELYTEQTGVAFADTQYEGSGALTEMLAGGAYADALITASRATMDTAEEEGYIVPATRFNMFTNDLVLVAGMNSSIESLTLQDLASGEYTLAVGDANVPAGNYAKQALTTTDPQCWISADGTIGADCAGRDGTFEGTPLEGKVTEGSSVGNVCQYANSGDVDIAMVYSSDVFRFGNVKTVGVTPADSHKSILYPAAVCTGSEYAEQTQAFLEWAFTSEDAIKIWQEWGFEIAS